MPVLNYKRWEGRRKWRPSLEPFLQTTPRPSYPRCGDQVCEQPWGIARVWWARLVLVTPSNPHSKWEEGERTTPRGFLRRPRGALRRPKEPWGCEPWACCPRWGDSASIEHVPPRRLGDVSSGEDCDRKRGADASAAYRAYADPARYRREWNSCDPPTDYIAALLAARFLTCPVFEAVILSYSAF